MTDHVIPAQTDALPKNASGKLLKRESRTTVTPTRSCWPSRRATQPRPGGVRLLSPAEPVTRNIFTVSRRGGDRQPAVRVVLDALFDSARPFD